MRSKILIFSATILLLSPTIVQAQVVINEFCSNCTPEWVELYNLSPNPVDLDGWSFLFGSPNQSLVISNANYPNDRTIGASDFFLVTLQSNWLNNSGDTIQFFDESSSNPLDETSYSGTIISEKTYSRIPDGSGTFVANTTATKNSYNQAPTPTQVPTLTPTSTPIPTLTPKPSPTNKPTSSNSPTSVPPTKSSSPTPPANSPTSRSTESQSNATSTPTPDTESNSLVLGDSSDTPTPTVTEERKESDRNRLPTILSAIGLIIVLFSLGLAGYKYYLASVKIGR